MTYECPIADMFTASSVVRDQAAWFKFVNMLRRKNRARVKVISILHCRDRKVGNLEGDFVALDSQTA